MAKSKIRDSCRKIDLWNSGAVASLGKRGEKKAGNECSLEVTVQLRFRLYAERILIDDKLADDLSLRQHETTTLLFSPINLVETLHSLVLQQNMQDDTKMYRIIHVNCQVDGNGNNGLLTARSTLKQLLATQDVECEFIPKDEKMNRSPGKCLNGRCRIVINSSA
ncbi:hypothetical protein CDAR_176621 [Caerostris darwini]|uniref:Uncharacterized protein n=1 Tax=Caerostris darwini TaxID=1538125 RepID=A0AAV4VJE4_9ARAC|nr:hypothetical protein CDAR_176621 [Caerostris darwini]